MVRGGGYNSIPIILVGRVLRLFFSQVSGVFAMFLVGMEGYGRGLGYC